MSITFAGISKVRARLVEAVAGLRAAASGAVVERAAAKVQAQIDAVSKRLLSKHVATGNALATASTTRSGGLVQLVMSAYLHFHGWWIFRSGIPPFAVAFAVKVFGAELLAAISGRPSPLLLAEEAAEESAAEKSRAKFRRDVRAIYRKSDEYKTKRREERAYDRRVKASEGREGR